MRVLFKSLITTQGRTYMTDASPVQMLNFTPKKHATSEIYKKHL